MTVGALDTLTSLRHDMDVLIPLGGLTLEGFLSVPQHAEGIVLFAHGSGSSRHSPRNRFVAEQLYHRGFATLLTDLLTSAEEKAEEETRHLRFDIGLLADRLAGTVEWVGNHAKIGHKPLGLFGASTGAASALVVASKLPEKIKAVVSRGGRPDLAGECLGKVEAPALLIVGGNDREVLRLNKTALAQLNHRSRLEIILEATHLFEEPGALEKVAALAASWFEEHL